MAQDTRIGTTVASYSVERLLGRGGMGRVYLAKDPRLGRKVALKILDPELAEDRRFRARFVKESRLAASLDHPNVIPIFEAGEQDGVLFIAMRYVEGLDLARLLEQEGALPPDRTTRIVSQVAAALDAAHEQGLIHRDVKPGNILMGRGDHAYLTDFGLIKRRQSETDLTKTGEFMGSVDYVAPEQIKGEAVDPRTDVYSLGCVLYECLVGEPPFGKDNEVAVLYAHMTDAPPKVTAKRPESPEAIDRVVATAMAKKADERFQAVGDLAAAVSKGLDTERKAPAPRQRRRSLLVAITLVAVGLLAGGLVLFRHPTNPVSRKHYNPMTVGTAGAVKIDSRSNRVTPVIPGPPLTGVLGGTGGIAAGEGAVWMLTPAGVRVLDPKTNKITKTIPYAPRTLEGQGIAVGFGSVWVFEGIGGNTGYVVRIDPALKEPGRPIPLKDGNRLNGGIATGAGAVWVTLNYSIARIDPTTNRVTYYTGLGISPDRVAVGGGEVWVADQLRDSVSAFNPRTGRIARTISVPSTPQSIAVIGGAVWFLDSRADTVGEFGLGATKVENYIGLGTNYAHALAAGAGSVWVIDAGGTLYRIDAGSRALTPIHLGGGLLASVAVDSHTNLAWVVRSK